MQSDKPISPEPSDRFSCRFNPLFQRFTDSEGLMLGYQIHGTGRATVILDAGFHDGSTAWSKVAPELTSFATVAVVDRSCLLDSCPRSLAQTPEQAVRQLRQLLDCARLTAPLVLVGWSLGGIYARAFAKSHPSDVRGLVLVDPVPDGFPGELIRDPILAATDQSDYLAMLVAQLWLVRELFDSDALAPQDVTRALTVSETFISRGDHPEPTDRLGTRLVELQQRDLRQRPHAREVIAGRSGENVPVDRPDVVVDAIYQYASPVR